MKKILTSKRKQSYVLKVFLMIMLFVLVFESIISIFGYKSMYRSIEEKVGESATADAFKSSSLMQVLTDSIANDAMHLVMLISQTDNSNRINSQFFSDDSVSILNKRCLYTTILNRVMSNKAYESIYLYDKSNDYVISTESEFAQFDMFSDQSWLESYTKLCTEDPTWIETRTVTRSTILTPGSVEVPVRHVITYVYPVIGYITPSFRGYIVFNLYEKELATLLNADASTSGRTIITTSEGMVLCDPDTGNISTLSSELLENKRILISDSGYFKSNSPNGRIIVGSCRLAVKPEWYAVRFRDMSEFREQIASRNVTFLLVICIIFMTSVLSAFAISRRISMPFIDIKNTIEQNSRFVLAEPNDVNRVRRALQYLIEEEKSLRDELHRKNKNIRSVCLYSLLVNNKSSEYHDVELERLLNENANVTLYLSDDTEISSLRDYSEEERTKYQKLMIEICEDIIKQPGTKFSHIVMENDNLIIVHFAARPEKDDLIALKERLRCVVKNVTDTLNMPMTIGISCMWFGPEQAHSSYIQAKHACRYKFLRGYMQVIEYASLPTKQKDFLYPQSYEDKLVTAFRHNNCEEAILAIEGLFSYIAAQSEMTIEKAMLVLQLFTASLVRNMWELVHMDGINPGPVTEILRTVFYGEIRTIDEMRSYLIRRVEDVWNATESAETLNLFEKITSYIHENYKRDIGIEDVANALGLSYYNTRKVFKENTDGSIIEYIHRLRIDEAMTLLKNTNISIADIASQVGYNSEQSFTRVFKKQTLMLPSTYRRDHAD